MASDRWYRRTSAAFMADFFLPHTFAAKRLCYVSARGVNYMQLQIIVVQRIVCSVVLLPKIALFDSRFRRPVCPGPRRCFHVLTSSPRHPDSDFFFAMASNIVDTR